MNHEEGISSSDARLLQVALIIFSAVGLATLEFVKHSFPHRDAVEVHRISVIYTLILLQLLPALALFAADRYIAARDRTGKLLQRFRSGLFVVAFLLILRQLQLYWAPGRELADSLRSVSVVLLLFVGLLAVAGVVGLCISAYRGVLLFFYYMSPIAIALAAIVPYQMPTAGALPSGYDLEVAAKTPPQGSPAVFVFIFDEMAYKVLAKEGTDELDTEAFPNFTKLAQEGVWFSNATTNFFRTWQASPLIINSVTPLADQYSLRLYVQYPTVENIYIKECGKKYTCRGAAYLARHNRPLVATNLALRSLYQVAPDAVETVIEEPVGWVVNAMKAPYPAADPPGYHMFTKRIFDTLLDDIDGEKSLGRIHVTHILLPHLPFAFDAEGSAIDPGSGLSWESYWRHYRAQAMFADKLIGELIDKLKAEGIYDESAVIITADHGLRRIVPTPPLPKPLDSVDQLMVQVPLIIRAPGLNSHISDVDYQHIDFRPTLMDILGLPVPDDLQGVSAFAEERPRRDKLFYLDQYTYVYDRSDDAWYVRQ